MRIINLTSKRGFTLIEIMLVTVIFAMMSVVIMQVYIQITLLSQRLEMSRVLADSAREVTERIATDVREKGIDTHPTLSWTNQYTSEGNDTLHIRGGIQYIFGKRDGGNIFPCRENDLCSIFRVEDGKYDEALNILDMFTPEDADKKVSLSDFHFFVSGDSDTASMDEPKVMVLGTFSLTAKSGIPVALREGVNFTIQTTLSERSYKSY